MKVMNKNQTRAMRSVNREGNARRSPYLALKPPSIQSKNLEGIERLKMGRTLSPYLG